LPLRGDGVLTHAMSAPEAMPTCAVRRRATGSRRVARTLAAAVVVAGAVVGCGGHADSLSSDDSAMSASGAPTTVTPAPAVAALQSQFEQVVQAVSPAVVQIESGGGLGSGVVYDDKGDVVTNAHVVGDATRFQVTGAAGKRHEATLVGSFPAGDLAVVNLSGATPKPARFGDSSKVRVGDFALAIGNPLGLRSSVTDGIVSSVGRTVSEGGGVTLTSAIQTSAPINPGNSGGALVDIAARVIGIPTLAALDPELGGAQAPGIGFAIPSNTVRSIADQLIATGRVTRSGRPFLGVSAATIAGGGVLVTSVERGGPAEKAGIQPGDVIVAINGHPTPSTDALATVLAEMKPGQKARVEISRDGRRQTVEVTLGELPAG
jgi:putative serine protease PepD